MQDRTDDSDSVNIAVGKCLHIFEPSIANVVAGFILSILAGAGGLALIVAGFRMAYLANFKLPIHVDKGSCWLAVGLFVLIGIAVCVGGVFMANFSKRLLRHRVEICENGYRYLTHIGVEEVLWTQIHHIKETILYERPPILKGPAKLLLPKIASNRYTVATADGKEHGFDGNSVKNISEFGGVLRNKATQLSLHWETVEEHA